jgi:hypothetical protein
MDENPYRATHEHGTGKIPTSRSSRRLLDLILVVVLGTIIGLVLAAMLILPRNH